MRGLLEIPKLGVRAPVEDGTTDDVLSVAVGHDPHSVWPGQSGNTVLEAHDVTYFVDLPALDDGGVISYVGPCTTWDFVVQDHAVVQQGAPVYDTPGPTLSLVTCWPTDALWFTPDRFVVTATLLRTRPTTGTAHTSPPPVPVLAAPMAPALAAEGVTLATNAVPMGQLAFAGTPAPAWAQSPAPLAAETAAIEDLIGGTKALLQGHPDWWRSIAPGVAAPFPPGATALRYTGPVEVTETVERSHLLRVGLSAPVTITTAAGATGYLEKVMTAPVHGRLVVTSWALTS